MMTNRPGVVPCLWWLLPALVAVTVPPPLSAQTEAPGGPVTLRAPGAERQVPMPLAAPRENAVLPGTSTPEPVEDPVALSEPDAAPEPDADSTGVALRVPDPAMLDGIFASYFVRNGRQIPASLTGAEGDPVEGRRLYHNFSLTGCSLCHGSAEGLRADDDGRTAPALHGIGQRLSPGRIRLWIVAPETIRRGTPMPAFHKPGQRDDPSDPLFGGPRLTAAEVEDIVAYLTRDAPEGGVAEPPDANVIPGQAGGG